jgi:hypothetical protein
VAALDSCRDCLQDALPIRHNIVVVEAKNSKALLYQERIATCITVGVPRFKMLAAIELDHEVCGVTNEIDDIGTNRGLPPKARTTHAMGAKCSPYQAFGIG